MRQKCDLHPAAKPKKLPRILTADQFRAFYKVVDAADDVQHALMLRLLFYTGVRVSELCNIEVADIDLENCKIFVNQGKGRKIAMSCSASRSPPPFAPTLPPIPQNRYLFQTRRCGKFSHEAGAAGGQAVCGAGGRERHAPYIPPPGDHLVDEATRGWPMPSSSSSRGMLGGRRWRSTSTSPWTGSWRTITRRR